MQQAQNIHVTRNHVRLVDQYLVRDGDRKSVGETPTFFVSFPRYIWCEPFPLESFLMPRKESRILAIC